MQHWYSYHSWGDGLVRPSALLIGANSFRSYHQSVCWFKRICIPKYLCLFNNWYIFVNNPIITDKSYFMKLLFSLQELGPRSVAFSSCDGTELTSHQFQREISQSLPTCDGRRWVCCGVCLVTNKAHATQIRVLYLLFEVWQGWKVDRAVALNSIPSPDIHVVIFWFSQYYLYSAQNNTMVFCKTKLIVIERVNTLKLIGHPKDLETVNDFVSLGSLRNKDDGGSK